MSSIIWPFICICSFAVGVGEAWGGVDYEREVKPLLQARCYACHGGLKQKGGLRLDTVAAMRRGGESGPAVVPGAVGESGMMERVTAVDVAERMPPEHEGEALTEEELGVLRGWIEGGASGPADERPEADPREHWAFRPVVRPVVPVIGGPWGVHPIDAFMAEGHRKAGVVAQPVAPAEVRLRRLTYDLIGLPPTSESVASVVGDGDGGWYEALVEQLLADPRHGERWGRHWMDVWRYSDWWGLGDQLRNSQKHIWHWRDWIVESLNGDLSYAEMVREMLAADELYPGDLSKLRATGFLARNYFLFNRNQWMEETVEHVSKGLLGLTMNCAKCHDHKYDPVDQRDYYRMRAIFEPYHVRLDGVPGEADWERDGVPRVYDGWLDAPTWRFVRGEESRPDRSVVMNPGVPGWLGSDRFEVRLVELPEEAWQPERRPWVLDAHLAAADRVVAVAESACREAEKLGGEGDGRLRVARVARVVKAVAEAKRGSVRARAEALRAGWCHGEDAGEKRVQAVRAERAVVVAEARRVVVEKEAAMMQEPEERRVEGEKELAAARESLAKAELAESEPLPPNPEFPGLPGARWTPTRFKNSTVDDPEVLFPSRSTGRRRALAEWMTDPRHPLTARVAVNHIWMRHMGAPLVATPFDFGRKGAVPTHRELLDWLAAEFVEHGWSQKHLHRLIVTSKVYQLSSTLAGAEEAMERDPDNRWYWRRTPGRLEAEVVRDALLRHAGQLDESRGGPPVPPAEQADSKRRSLYFFHSNNDRNIFLATFDAAAVKECYRREQSIVPQQALALSNSRLVQDAARAIAERLSSGGAGADGEDEDFIRRAWMELLAERASEAEVVASRGAMRRWRELEPADPMAPRVHFIGTLLSHNDFLTIR